MSLKDLTKHKHTEAEQTPFMQAVIKGKMPADVWTNYTYNKMLCYSAIEAKSRAENLLVDLPDIERTYKLYQDVKEMVGDNTPDYKEPAIEYHRYILDLTPGKVLAHLYVWHMGDLFGGQMIKKIMPNVPHRNLDFKDAEVLKMNIRSKLDDSLADEANGAFDWAIRIMNSYTIA